MGRKKTRRSMAGPLMVVGSLTGRQRASRKSWKTGAEELAGRARALPDQLGKVVAGPLPKGVAKHVPSRRKRKKMVKTLTGDIERLSGLASGLSTVLGLAATGGELLSVLRDRQAPGGSEEDAPEDRQGGARDASSGGDDEESSLRDGSDAHDRSEDEDTDDESTAGSHEEDEGDDEGPAAGYDDVDESSSEDEGAEESGDEVGDDERVPAGRSMRRAS